MKSVCVMYDHVWIMQVVSHPGFHIYTVADTVFGRGRGQNIFRWDNGVWREATEGGLEDFSPKKI